MHRISATSLLVVLATLATPARAEIFCVNDAAENDSPRRVGAHVDIGAFENEKIFVNGVDPPGPF